MCRNITELRGLEPAATQAEIDAAALQYIRKVTGLRNPSGAVLEAYEQAVAEVARATATVLAVLPARRQPPVKLPPLRRGKTAP